MRESALRRLDLGGRRNNSEPQRVSVKESDLGMSNTPINGVRPSSEKLIEVTPQLSSM